MNSKILILSHPKLTAAVQQVMNEMEQLPEVTIRNVGFGDVINFLNTNLSSLKPNIIITGGAHWKMLNRSDYRTRIPIIAIPVTQFDLLQAALHARQFGKRIAVIYYGDELKEGNDVLKDFDCHFQFFSYSTKEDAISIITSLRETGIDAIIGAGMVCALTDSFNIPSVFLHSKDSIIKILDHVTRFEKARLDMVATAQKWSLEFMKNPLLTYEIDSMIETFKTSSFSFPAKIDSTNSRYTLLEDFLFNKKISSFFTKPSNPFYDQNYPYVSFGIIEDVENNVELIWKKFENDYDFKVFYSIKDYQCRFLILSKNSFTCTLVNKKLKASLHRIYIGVSTSVHYDDAFSSNDSVANKIFEAEVAFELAKSNSMTEPICIFDQSNPFTLLFSIAIHNDLPETPFLKPLFGHRNTNKLLSTLRLLLDHGLSITTVANHLGISRQTVYSLLNRIESLIGILTDPEKRFALSLELRILEIKKAMSAVNKGKMEFSNYSASSLNMIK